MKEVTLLACMRKIMLQDRQGLKKRKNQRKLTIHPFIVVLPNPESAAMGYGSSRQAQIKLEGSQGVPRPVKKHRPPSFFSLM